MKFCKLSVCKEPILYQSVHENLSASLLHSLFLHKTIQLSPFDLQSTARCPPFYTLVTSIAFPWTTAFTRTFATSILWCYNFNGMIKCYHISCDTLYINVKARKERWELGMSTYGMREENLTNEGGKGTKGRRIGRRGNEKWRNKRNVLPQVPEPDTHERHCHTTAYPTILHKLVSLAPHSASEMNVKNTTHTVCEQQQMNIRRWIFISHNFTMSDAFARQ